MKRRRFTKTLDKQLLWSLLLLFGLHSIPKLDATSKKDCHYFSSSMICLNNQGEGTLSVELHEIGSLTPNWGFYTQAETQSLQYMDWSRQNYLHLTNGHHLVERKFKQDYQLYDKNGIEIVDCVGKDCFSSEINTIQPKLTLQPGDLVFSGEIQPYSSHQRSIFTHVSLVLESGQVLSYDMGESGELAPPSEIFTNLTSIAIFQHPKLVDFALKIDQSIINKRQFFCTSFLSPVLYQLFQKASKPPDAFERVHPEYLFWRLSDLIPPQLFQTATKSLNWMDPEFRSNRITELETQRTEWLQILKEPRFLLQKMFAAWFPFTPLTQSNEAMEFLLSQAHQGAIPSDSETTSPKVFQYRIENYPPSTTPEHRELNTKKKCFESVSRENTMCVAWFSNRKLRSVEEFGADLILPRRALYFRESGILHSYVDYLEKKYAGFDEEGNLKALKSGKNYWNRNGIRCSAEQCIENKQTVGDQFPELSGLQTGDIVFTGNLLDYNAHLDKHFTHISIFLSGDKIENALFLSNDISSPLTQVGFETTFKNTHSFAVFRDPQLATVFKDSQYATNTPQTKIPFFCANLFANLMQAISPQKLEWNQLDRNHVDAALFKSQSRLQLIYYFNPDHRFLDSYLEKSEKRLEAVRLQIEDTMREPDFFLERLFYHQFEMLPIEFEKGFVRKALQVMQIHSPFRWSTNPLD